jgi:hypothetical protein
VQELLTKSVAEYDKYMMSHYPDNKITDFIERMDKPEYNDEELTNVQKIRLLANKESEVGNEEISFALYHLADSMDQTIKFLGESEFNNSDINIINDFI